MEMLEVVASMQMRQCTIRWCLLSILLFTQSVSFAQNSSFEEMAIAKVKATPTSEIEAGMSKLPFEVWLQNLAGKDAELKWELNDCGEGTGGPADRERDMPLCIGANAKLPDGRYLTAEIGVASASDMKSTRLPGGIGVRDVYAGYKDVPLTSGSGLDSGGALIKLEEFMKVDARSIGLYYAAAKGDAQMVQDMLKQGADIHSGYGKEAFLIAIKNGKIAVIPLLLKAGADVNSQTKYGETALSLASWMNENIDITELLLANGANTNSINDALDSAAGRGRINTMQILIKAGADVNYRNNNKNTPLMEAASENDIEAMKILLDAGADVNAVSSRNRNILGLSALGNSAWVVNADRRNVDGLLLLLKHGAEIRPKNAESPLISAIDIGSLERTRVLLEYGADINTTDQYFGYTPLMKAVAFGYLNITKLLIEKGADLNLRGKNGSTALSIAIEKHLTKIAKLLKNAGAKQ